MRRCAWTRKAYPKDELIRLVLDPTGRVFVDVLGRAPGRGIYIVPDRNVIAAALSPKGLNKLFRGRAGGLGFAPEAEKTQAVDDLKSPHTPSSPSDHIARLLSDRAIELVALARRAGQLEVGTDIVLQALDKRVNGSVLILAHDLSSRTARRIHEQLTGEQQGRVKYQPEVCVFGSKDDFGAALGRAPTGVLYCSPGTLADRIATEGKRLSALVAQPDWDLIDLHAGVGAESLSQDVDSLQTTKPTTRLQHRTRSMSADLSRATLSEASAEHSGGQSETGRVGATRYSD